MYPLGVPIDLYTNPEPEKKIEELPRLIPKKENKFSDVYQSLKRVFESYPYADYDPFYCHIEKILQKLR
jgi:acetyl-CoA carboxylase carboxyltransferase component